ncbi:MAG: YraN family protein [Lutibacter sp.]|jgi:putative endonuclease|nr:YraN family protein [Lutibacter sp.]
MATHYELGKKGEAIAADFLQKKGYRILERNWRFQKAEVDILAFKNGLLVAVEVKTRTDTYFGNPQDFINRAKIERLVTAVDAYIQLRQLVVSVRFDIVALVKNGPSFQIEHLEDAFYHF